ncbi:hypothetical protein CIW71_09735 [Xanthomonas citri pv. malvacearum]|nr:hypothetical protein CIW71_09735 [Xanthomonas citri pv. malvacearum]
MALQKGQRLREAGQFEVAAVGQIKSAGDNTTLDGARADVFDYIERRHNPRMRRRAAKQDQKVAALLQPSVISG